MRTARTVDFLALPVVCALGLVACKPEPALSPPTPSAPVSGTASVSSSASASGTTAREDASLCGGLSRLDFNRLAVQLNLPVYWNADRNKNGAADPDEVAQLLFYSTAARWVDDGRFTPAFAGACKAMTEARQGRASGTPQADLERRMLVLEDLDQGRPTLVYNDLRSLADEEKAFARRMLETAGLIDSLFARQNGSDALRDKVPVDDVASQSLFRRNWGPRCVAPKTENQTACSAVPGGLKPLVDAYPAELQGDPAFCQRLEKDKNAKGLLAPFVVVRSEQGKLVPRGLQEAYPDRMGAVAAKLKEAAGGIANPKESALKAYLEAASASFGSNDWLSADEAWTRMNAQNSRWYLRVAPDETYWDPCGHKAGFHLTFALINQDSLAWQQRLDPVRQDMEEALAKLIGKPYKARKVSFHLPDFVDIVLNAGDDRDPMGATIGQSLPNWGKVADEGRGRTIAMSNLYTDPDSLEVDRQQAESLFTKDSLSRYPTTKDPRLLSTILHEATHNLGPSHDYKFRGRTDDQAFGGGLSATMEELKAQSGALWYLAFLLKKGIISQELAEQSYLDSFTWALNHVARGMYTADKKPKPYSQLAAIQIGFLLEQGALSFEPQGLAANGKDQGAFRVHYDKLPAAVEKLMTLVGTVKATNDKQNAEELVRTYVDGNVVPHRLIAERILRFPKASFVYAVDL